MSKLFYKRNNCRICDSTLLTDFFNFGNLPIPNGFLTKKLLQRPEKKYPLVLCFCINCGLVQLRHIVNPEVMFKNYLYIPSSSQTRIEHFRELANQTKMIAHLNEQSLVIDVGSNDGSLLRSFKNLGIQVLGVDPAENLVTVAQLNGIETMLGYFNTKTAQKIQKKYKKASALLATNVVAHIDNLKVFLEAVYQVLDTNGILITQFPYLMDLLEKNQFDTVYHEHLSYFSLKPLLHLANQSQMEIIDVQRNNLDGGSIRVFWKKKENSNTPVNSDALRTLLSLEEKNGLYDEKTYKEFNKKINALRKIAIIQLRKLKKKGKNIVGYGAAAKGNILLNYYGITNSLIDYVVDSTPYKQGLYTPGSHIPIFDESEIYKNPPDYILILAWNFKDEIIYKNKKFIKSGGKFIIPVPDFKII